MRSSASSVRGVRWSETSATSCSELSKLVSMQTAFRLGVRLAISHSRLVGPVSLDQRTAAPFCSIRKPWVGTRWSTGMGVSFTPSITSGTSLSNSWNCIAGTRWLGRRVKSGQVALLNRYLRRA